MPLNTLKKVGNIAPEGGQLRCPPPPPFQLRYD